MGIRSFLRESDMLAGIDPTKVVIGNEIDFDAGYFDHSLDDVDGKPALDATSRALRDPSFRARVTNIAHTVLQSYARP